MHSSQTQILLDNLLERLNYYRTEEAITFYAPYKFELKQRIKQLKSHISKLRKDITENPNENIDIEELQNLYSLMSKESFSQDFIQHSKNVINRSTINVGRDFHLGDIYITKTTGLSIFLVFAFIIFIGIWQKEEIKIALGFDKFFVEDDQDFKIIILPFNEICKYNEKNYDAGAGIEMSLTSIIQKESLKIKTHYWESFDLEGFNDQKAEELRKYHNADMILYGTYQTESCSAEGNQICLNYLTDEKWNLGKTGNNIDKLDYKKGGLDALKKGKIQEKVENIAVFVSVLAQIKNIDHSKYLAKLSEILEVEDINSNIRSYIYLKLASDLFDEGVYDVSLTYQEKALEIYLKADNKYYIGITYRSLGIYYLKIGSLEKALSFFKLYNENSTSIYSNTPNNISAKTSLAVSYLGLGQTYFALGNLNNALSFYQKANYSLMELHKSNHANLEIKQNLSYSYCFLADTYVELGDLENSLSMFKKSNALVLNIYKNVQSITNKYDLGVSYNRLGQTYYKLGYIHISLDFFEKHNKIMLEICENQPNSIFYKHDLANSYSELGDIYISLNNFEKALFFFEKSNYIITYLTKKNRQFDQFKVSLGISYFNLGRTHKYLGNTTETLEYFTRMNSLFKIFYDSNTSNIKGIKGLATSYEVLGDFYYYTDEEKANTYYLKSKMYYFNILQKSPNNMRIRENLLWVENQLNTLK